MTEDSEIIKIYITHFRAMWGMAKKNGEIT
jgi:hypothetical protein